MIHTTSGMMQSEQQCRLFSLVEIKLATQNFNEALLIGRGGFGRVYRGTFDDGSTAAIKRLDHGSKQGAPEFWAEIKMLSRLRHFHIVTLIGYCDDEREMIIVYELMSYGSLADHLHKRRTRLSWLKRLNICIDAARGLDYLHTSANTHHRVIHRDVKSTNILLDDKCVAKISDFGLSQVRPINRQSTFVSTAVKGTFGYMDPEYFSTRRLTSKSDVYSFGVVLLEVLCGRPAVDESLDEEQWGLVGWAQDNIKEGKLLQIIDSCLSGQILLKCSNEFAQIALRCLHNRPKERPTMAEVVVSLEFVLTLNMIPTLGDKMQSMGFPSEQPCRRFSLAEITFATHDFDEALLIGRGGFGKVYKGTFVDGSVAAIKHLDSRTKQGGFCAEIEMLSKIRHCHIVTLIGFCDYQDEMILVFELMPNGTLADHLHKGGTRLSWMQRLKISIGAARGLDYLHTGTGTHQGFIHRDIKSSNILLDDKWESKITDFGSLLACPTNQPSTSIETNVVGTSGYIDPEYISTRKVTRKADVYSFGVVLLEVLCGRRAMDTSLEEQQHNLARWAQHCIEKGRLLQIIDSCLNGQILLNCSKEFALIAQRCVHYCPEKRPTMAEVVVSLEFVLALQETLDYSELDYGATPATKITFTRSSLKFFLPSTDMHSVHGQAGTSRNNGISIEGNSCNEVSNKDLAVNKDGNISQEVLQSGQFVTLNLTVFTFAELRQTTRNFSHDMLLGEGSSGVVYKGWVDKDTYAPSLVGKVPVAIKKLHANNGQGIAEWQAEVNFLGQFSHPNLIHLLGYCMEDQECILVYEFMQNGSLDQILFSKLYVNPLPWTMRLKIMIGAAQGLVFLHTMDKQVIHRNFKSSSILLDEYYNPKLSGFGLAKFGPECGRSHVSTRITGTSGYAAPEYVLTGHLTVKSDVYGFGVVLLEVLTGQPVLDGERPSAQRSLVEWMRPYLSNKRKVNKIIDIRLKDHYPRKGAVQAAMLVLNCLQPEPKHRLSMKEVVQTLEKINAINF